MCVLSGRLSGRDLPIDAPYMFGTTAVVGISVVASRAQLAIYAGTGTCGGASLRGLHLPCAPSSTHTHDGLERVVDPPLETYVGEREKSTRAFISKCWYLRHNVAVWIAEKKKKNKEFRGSELPQVLFDPNV